MKIAVVGSRDFCDRKYLEETVREYISRYIPTEFISGGAKGVDSWAEEVAVYNEIPTKIFKADWDKLGKGAGFIRNKKIVERADIIVAFWDGKSKGTQNSIAHAIKLDKPIDIYIRSC